MELLNKGTYHSVSSTLISIFLAANLQAACGNSGEDKNMQASGSEVHSVESDALCSTLNSALLAAKGKKAFLREGAPILPRGFWLTESDNIQKGSFLSFDKVSCNGEKVVLEYRGQIKFKQGLLGQLKEQTIQFRDEYTVGTEGKITGSVLATGRSGQVEATGVKFSASVTAGKQISYVTFLPFPLPVCPAAVGVENFDTCRVRLDRKVQLTSGSGLLQGFDKITIEALNKTGGVARTVEFQGEKITFSTNGTVL